MKSDYMYLFLPIVATLANLLLALAAISHQANAQAVYQHHHVGSKCPGGGDANGQCGSALDLTLEHDELSLADENDDEDEEDPMLKRMPPPDDHFKAYVRADISSFYREAPGSKVETKPAFNGQAAKFINLSPETVELYWVGPQGPFFHGRLRPWASKGTASFPAHHFQISKLGEPDNAICDIKITRGIMVYYCNPYVENSNTAHAEWLLAPRSLEDLSPADREQYDAHIHNLEFAERYRNFTGGNEWLSFLPRDPPKNPIWRADYFGQEHVVQTAETHFFALPQDSSLPSLSVQEMKDSNKLASYRAPGVMNMTIKAVSCAPRAFEIRNFLSEVEADHILDVVQRQNQLRRSSTGSGEISDTRTSKTTWISRNTDAVLNAVYRRAADALRIDEALLRNRLPGERPDYDFSGPINEELQIVHYDPGQEYTAHHDFGYSTRPGRPSRSVNLCLYLNNVPAGGTTSFPRWRNAETTDGIHVKPEKTKAMIFYMINPDGNVEDLSQHAADPVQEGEKWFANLWIWDPYKTT